MLLLAAATTCLYVAASWLIWLRATDSTSSIPCGATTIRLVVTVVICLHGVQLYRSFYNHGVINLALGNGISLLTWMTVVLFLFASMIKQTLNLGLIVLPSGLFGFFIGWLIPGEQFLLEDLPDGIGRHIAIAIPAYGILGIAFAQALVLWIQEKQLHKSSPGSFFPALPAIETMESNLFQLTWLGFGLLTINLVTGMINTWQNYGSFLLFNHHTLLASLAWGGFGGLLVGHKVFGWRGQVAARWTMVAFIILAMAYFGTRFVSGVILHNLH